MSGLTDRLRTAATHDTSPRDGDGAQLAHDRESFARRLLIAALVTSTILSIAAWLLLAHHYAVHPGTRVYGYWREGALGFAILMSVGAVLAVKMPLHPIAWTFGAINLVGSIQQFLGTYGDYALFARPDELPGGLHAAVISSAAQATFVGTLVLLIALFPTGRALTPRWRVVPGGALAAAVAVPFTIVLNERPWLDDEAMADVVNPLAPAFGDIAVQIAGGVVAIGLVVGLLGGLAQLVVRYRRAATDQRLQIKLFTMFAVAAPIILLAPHPLHDIDPGWVLWTLVPSSLPAAIGVAIVKHRLYGVDVVISKTLVFAGLAGFITSIYVGIVVGVGTLLGAGDEPNLALSIVATAVVAVAFQPVRERLTRLANRLVFGRRATPYEVLSRFSEHLGEVAAPEQTLQRMARLLADGTGAARAQVWLRIGGELRPAATWPAHMTDDTAPDHRVEVIHEGELLGALSLDKQRGETLTPTDQKLVDDLAAQAGLVLRNLRLSEELKAKIVDLQASRQRLVAAQDAERRRLERDLRDGAQRQLLELKSRLAVAGSTAAEEQADEAARILEQVTGDADDTVATLRELAHGIFPPLLAAEGLAGALRAQAAKAAVPVVVDPDGVGRYSQEVEAAVYFCVLEAVQNAAKYANPTQVTIRLGERDGELVFEVSDDGDGFDPATTAKGHGTTNMTDRLDAVDGHLDIRSVPGSGTVVAGRVPTSRPDEVAVREIRGSGAEA